MVAKVSLLSLLLVTTLGCISPKVPVKPGVVTFVIPRPCMLAVALSDHAECRGKDEHSLMCTGILITRRQNCAQWEALPPSPPAIGKNVVDEDPDEE